MHDKYKFQDNREFWSRWKREKTAQSDWWRIEKEDVAYYFKWKSQIRRNAQNFPVQGSSATITKLAGIYFFRWIKENNLLHKVLISNIVHDEYLTEQPKELSKETAIKLKECMEKAGKHYCKIVPLKADPKVTDHWEH